MNEMLDIEVVEKYNPNHDQKGRFTTYGSATSFTITTRNTAYQNKAQDAKAKEAIRTGHRGASKVNVNDPEYQKKVSDGEARIKQILGENTKVSLTGMDADMIDGTVDAIAKTVERFPLVKASVESIEVKDYYNDEHLPPGTGAMAYCAGNKIVLNAGDFGNAEYATKEFDRCVREGFHPEGTDVNSVIVHEIGHSLDNLISRHAPAAGFMYNVSDKIWEDDRKKIVKKNGVAKRSDMAEGLSLYGAKNGHEYLAEAFSEVVSSSKSRAKAKSIVKRFTTQYNHAVDSYNSVRRYREGYVPYEKI